MSFDFDQVIPLRDTHSAKVDRMAEATGVSADDAIAMWVADMDFRPPQSVLDTLQAELDRGVFGYFGNDAPVRAAACDWMAEKHGWRFEPEAMFFTHGVVAGFAIALDAVTEPGDEVIVFSPVYHAFFGKAKAVGRTIFESPLVVRDGRFAMDLDTLEQQLTGAQKAVVFCTPHNPGGTLWTREEINALADFCIRNDLALISDEIHMDLVHPGHAHLPTAVAAPQVHSRLITLTAASKGFNIAGAETGFAVIEDPALRGHFARAHANRGSTPNRFGMLMMAAAFRGGAAWSDAVRAYIAENFAILRDGLNAIPGVSVMDMPSTYLAWVDFSGTGMDTAEIAERVGTQARIGANAGPSFGTGGARHMRFNIAAPRSLVVEAVERLQGAFADLQ